MLKPDTLPIKRMDDLHTNLIGCTSAGQFMIIDYYDGHNENKAYVVRYLFDESGILINTKHSIHKADAPHDETQKQKHAFLHELEPYRLCDIRVRPFEIRIDGITFGLVYSKETQAVNLEPGPLITFMAPWDGEYYT